MPDLSVKTLKKAQAIVNSDPNFRHLGNVDLTMGIKAGKILYLITFTGFSCQSVRKISASEVREADFVIEMSGGQWDNFITGCQSGDEPNLVQLDSLEYIVKANDPEAEFKFMMDMAGRDPVNVRIDQSGARVGGDNSRMSFEKRQEIEEKAAAHAVKVADGDKAKYAEAYDKKLNELVESAEAA